MKKGILKIFSVIIVLAMFLGVTDNFVCNSNYSNIIQAKSTIKKSKYKNGKIKSKSIRNYFSKKTVRKYKLPSRLKKQVYTKYNKKGKVTYRKIIKVEIIPGVRMDGIRAVKIDTRYQNYKKIQGKRKPTKIVENTSYKIITKNGFRKYDTNISYYSKYSGAITKEERIGYDYMNKMNIYGKEVSYYNKKGQIFKNVSYDYKKGRYVNPTIYYY